MTDIYLVFIVARMTDIYLLFIVARMADYIATQPYRTDQTWTMSALQPGRDLLRTRFTIYPTILNKYTEPFAFCLATLESTQLYHTIQICFQR